MENKITLNEKITVAKMTYGNIRRITSTLYITDMGENTTTSFGSVISGKQYLINIRTGEILEEKHVTKCIPSDANSRVTYSDGLHKSKNNIVYSLPQAEVNNQKTRIYTNKGNLIFEVNHNRYVDTRYKDYLLKSEDKILIYIEDLGNAGIAFIYDLNKNEIIKIYNNVVSIKNKFKGPGTLDVIPDIIEVYEITKSNKIIKLDEFDII